MFQIDLDRRRPIMKVQSFVAGTALALVLSAGAYAGVPSHARPAAAIATHADATATGHTAKFAEAEGVNGDRAKLADSEGVDSGRAKMADSEGVDSDRAKVAEADGAAGAATLA
jgi:hypothetical protein